MPVTLCHLLSKSRSKLLQIFITHVQRREIPGLAALRSYKDTAILTAFEVSLTLDRAIVLACRFVKSDTDPNAKTWDLRDQANIRYCATTSI
jgi:hypothetical protein